MDVQEHVGQQLGRFINWGQSVTIDQARRLMRYLPECREQQIVEFDAEPCPDSEELNIRISSL